MAKNLCDKVSKIKKMRLQFRRIFRWLCRGILHFFCRPCFLGEICKTKWTDFIILRVASILHPSSIEKWTNFLINSWFLTWCCMMLLLVLSSHIYYVQSVYINLCYLRTYLWMFSLRLKRNTKIGPNHHDPQDYINQLEPVPRRTPGSLRFILDFCRQ